MLVVFNKPQLALHLACKFLWQRQTFLFFLLSALLFSLNFFIFAEVKIEGNSLPCLGENFDVIGCCKQYQMVTRLQPGVAFVATGERMIFWRLAGM